MGTALARAADFHLKTDQQIGDWTFVKNWVDRFKEAKLNVVLANGCFDILHPGHLAKLEKAAAHHDEGLLVVSIDCDADVNRRKGPGRPFMPWQDRARLVSALRWVDLVTWHSSEPCHARPSGSCTLAAEIEYLKPDVWVARDELLPYDELDAAARAGSTVIRLPRHGDYSSSLIGDIVLT